MKKRFIKISAAAMTAILISGLFLCFGTVAADLPSKYITEAKTPVLNQKNNPLCWAYSGSDMLGINAIKNGYAENGTTVFSAPMMARAEFDGNEHRHCHGNVWYKCYGGIDYALLAATSGKGLLYNSDYPTVDTANSASAAALYSGNAYISEIRIVDTTDLTNKQRTEQIKKLILEYGAVNTDAFIGEYNKVTCIARLQPYDNSKASHVILLVGWDDTKYTDTGTGAFLLKNTWGESWGDNGYAWVSYNSEFGRNLFSANVVVDGDTRVFTHTETMFTSGNSSYVDDGKYGAVNVFDIDEKMTLNQVGVFTNKVDSEFTVYVYKNLSDVKKIKDATPDATAAGTAEHEGYYTLDLNKAVNVKPGDTVAVLYLVKSEKSYYVFSEYADPDFEMTVTSSKPGQSYTYRNGELTEPKGNYIGTLIGKTEHKEPPVTVTTEAETTTEQIKPPETTANQTEAVTTETDLVIEFTDDTDPEPIDTDNEPEGIASSLPVATETGDQNSETESDETRVTDALTTENTEEITSGIKKAFVIILIVIAAVVVLFILLILALIAASKKKKV